jgi:hypothetical protein
MAYVLSEPHFDEIRAAIDKVEELMGPYLVDEDAPSWNVPFYGISLEGFTIHTQTDEQFRDMVKRLGGTRTRVVGSTGYMHFKRVFAIDSDGHEHCVIRLYAPTNTQMCRKVPTGKKVQVQQVVPDYAYRTVEEDEYEWVCTPILEEDEA